MRGFSLIAIGHSTYGEWAINLARSLRYFCDLPIQLIYEAEAVKTINLKDFDVTTLVKPEDARPGGRLNPSFCKLRMYEYFPQDWETIHFLDVDALCIKDPTPLFDFEHPFGIQVTGVTNQESGVYGNMLWMELKKFREVFGVVGSVPGTNSSAIIVNRSDEAEQVFTDAQIHYHNFTTNFNSSDLHMRWGRRKDGSGILPDELFFNAALTGKENYSLGTPIKFHTKKMNRWEGIETYKKDHYYLGYWGNAGYNTSHIQKEYNRIATEVGGKPKISALLKAKFVNHN